VMMWLVMIVVVKKLVIGAENHAEKIF
jgi:hypothetical protein